MPMAWTDVSQISYEHHSFRVPSQATTHKLHGHIAKSAFRFKFGLDSCLPFANHMKHCACLSYVMHEHASRQDKLKQDQSQDHLVLAVLIHRVITACMIIACLANTQWMRLNTLFPFHEFNCMCFSSPFCK